MICEEAKMIFRHLGLRISVVELEDRQNFVEVLFEFSNDNSCYVKLIYDIDTDDYDCKIMLCLHIKNLNLSFIFTVLEMVPVHTNFNEIKRFLRNTGDIQGMIYTFFSCNRHNINLSNISDDRSSLIE